MIVETKHSPKFVPLLVCLTGYEWAECWFAILQTNGDLQRALIVLGGPSE